MGLDDVLDHGSDAQASTIVSCRDNGTATVVTSHGGLHVTATSSHEISVFTPVSWSAVVYFIIRQPRTSGAELGLSYPDPTWRCTTHAHIQPPGLV